MSETKHTPGPWTSSTTDWNCGNPVDDEMGFSIVSDKGWYIAEVWSTAGGSDEAQAPANAQLIAAAPDLYEALRRLLSMYGPPSDYDWPAADAWQKGVDAIAKAEGR